jgi:hypothetical protein
MMVWGVLRRSRILSGSDRPCQGVRSPSLATLRTCAELGCRLQGSRRDGSQQLAYRTAALKTCPRSATKNYQQRTLEQAAGPSDWNDAKNTSLSEGNFSRDLMTRRAYLSLKSWNLRA